MEHEAAKKSHAGEGAKMSLNSISSLFRESWDLYQERFHVLVEIILLPVLVLILGYILIALGSPFSIAGAVIVCVGEIIFVFSSLALIFSVHHNAGVDASYKAVTRWFLPLIWLVILDMLVLLGGAVMLIIPAIWLSVGLTFVTYVLVIEDRRGLDVLRQSRDYVKGYWWAILGRMLLLLIVLLVVSAILQLPFALLGGRILQSVVSMIFILLIVPFSVIYEYTMFQNLRTLKPHLAAIETKKGKGFLKVCAIVGVVTLVLLLSLLLAGIASGSYMENMNYNNAPSSPSSW
jgi:hypothetical protein